MFSVTALSHKAGLKLHLLHAELVKKSLRKACSDKRKGEVRTSSSLSRRGVLIFLNRTAIKQSPVRLQLLAQLPPQPWALSTKKVLRRRD